MSGLLFQGVEGVADISDSLRTSVPSAIHPSLSTDEDPKLREECGVVAVHGHPDAAREAYLGLYALQHRGDRKSVV